MSQYKITVVIPTYNTGESLYNLFNSLKNQTIGFKDIEVIFVDDNSSDQSTLDILDDLSSFDNVSLYYLDENSGFPGKGRNIGLSKAKGEYIIFSDHDDSYNEDAFKVMYDKIIAEDGDLLFTNYFKIINNKKVPVKTVFDSEEISLNSFKDDLRLFSLAPSIWTKLFRREFLIENNINFLEAMLVEDLEFYIHSLFLSKKTIYLDNFHSYNYSIRDNDKDKSTIHLRNKLIFSKMIEGYFKTNDLLEKLNKQQYFDLVFKQHFVYFLTSLIKSKISEEDKKELLIAINPLLKKELEICHNLDEKRYNKLTNYLSKDEYGKAIKEIKSINRKNKLKGLIKR